MSWNMNMKEIKERDKERMKVVSLVYLRVCLLPVEMETNFLKQMKFIKIETMGTSLLSNLNQGS